MVETTSLPGAPQPSKLWKWVFAVAGIMTTLVTYGVLQEKIMRVSYGDDKAFFKYLLFLVFCNRITTSAVFAGVLWARKKALDPVAPVWGLGSKGTGIGGGWGWVGDGWEDGRRKVSGFWWLSKRRRRLVRMEEMVGATGRRECRIP